MSTPPTINPADPRVIRTRRLLLDTARTLILESHAAPTLTEVARRAQMSRQAAYDNFGDLRGLLLALVLDSLRLNNELTVDRGRITPLHGTRDTSNDSRSRLEALARAIQADRDLFICLADLEPRGAMSEVVNEFCRNALSTTGWNAPSDQENEKRTDFDFAVGGIRGMLEAWIHTPRSRGPETLTNELLDRLATLGWTDPRRAPAPAP